MWKHIDKLVWHLTLNTYFLHHELIYYWLLEILKMTAYFIWMACKNVDVDVLCNKEEPNNFPF